VDEANEGGSSNELPWSAVFNPAANVRAFSAIQAAGFRAASELVERFVRIASTELDNSGGFAAGAAPVSDERGADLFGATGLQPLVSSWWTMADQFLRVSAPRGDEPARATAVTLDFVTSTATGALQLEATAPCTATTEVWLHNGGSTDLGKVRLRCSELLANDGAVVPAGELRFEPDIVPLPARSSRGVTVEVEIGQDVAPGSYRGTLLVDGYPDLWVPIELAITRLAS